MTGAIRNSLRLSSFSCSVESEESPLELGIAAALSPTSSVTSQSVVAPSGISKTAITNASFKTSMIYCHMVIMFTDDIFSRHLQKNFRMTFRLLHQRT